MKLTLLAIPFVLCACAATKPGPSPEVAAIQASCDDPNAAQTMINGKAYFCDDFATFQAQMNAIAQALHQRGI